MTDDAPQISPDMLQRMMAQMNQQQEQMERMAEALEASTARNEQLQARLDEAEGQRVAKRRVRRADEMSPDDQWKMAETDGGLVG